MYSDINSKSWAQILEENGGYQWHPPLTVHLPIQPVHAADFVHVDCALTAMRRRVFPNLSVREVDVYQAAAKRETLLVQFALEDPPFVPDPRRSCMTLEGGRWPVAQAEYFAYDIHYRFEYVCCPIGTSDKSLLWITCTVTNEGEATQSAHVRAKVNIQRECDVNDYHYAPFYTNAQKWLPCDKVSLQGEQIMIGGTAVGKLGAGGFEVAWESNAQFADDQYNVKFGCGTPCFITPEMRLKQVQDVLRFSAELEIGESRKFSLCLLVDFENVGAEDTAALQSADPVSCKQAALDHFAANLPEGTSRLQFSQGGWGDIFHELQLSTLQLLVRFPDKADLMPTQGGSSERHLVWVWEAVCMLMPMLRLGHFAAVRKALDFIFSLQDGGYPPEGQFTTLEGAIGTTGPRWINSTGSALALAADYYQYSHNEKFLEQYLPRMERAAGWIVGELGATRKLNEDGSRPLTYGLMPYGCATDGDIGYVIAFTDAYTYWGLEKAARLMESLGHPRAAEFRAEADQYRDDIRTTVDGLTRPDGYIDRAILVGGDELYAKFTATTGAANLAYAGALDATSAQFRNYIGFVETNFADGYFMGRMDREVVYTGVGEWLWQEIYLQLGEWKKAFAAVQANLKYGITPRTHQVQERFSRFTPAFTPWQPNGSGNGKVLDTIIKSLYFEHGDTATLLAGVPGAWLVANAQTALTDLHTVAGKVSLTASMADAGTCRLALEAEAGAMPAHLRIPEHFEVIEVPAGVTARGDGLYAMPAGCRSVAFTIKVNSAQ